MPTYDYVCDACGHKFELFQSITASAERKCPECKKLKLRRLIGAGAAVMFKGSGFYQTDYRSDSYKKQAQADSSSGSDSKKSGEGGEKKSTDTSGGESKSKPKRDGGGKKRDS